MNVAVTKVSTNCNAKYSRFSSYNKKCDRVKEFKVWMFHITTKLNKMHRKKINETGF